MDIALYVIIALIAVAIIGAGIYFGIKIKKMSKEDRKKLLVTFLKGAVALAEEEIGSGNGEAKLAMVEAYFNDKAPVIYKLILKALGKENLKEFIEEALSEIKNSFEK